MTRNQRARPPRLFYVLCGLALGFLACAVTGFWLIRQEGLSGRWRPVAELVESPVPRHVYFDTDGKREALRGFLAGHGLNLHEPRSLDDALAASTLLGRCVHAGDADGLNPYLEALAGEAPLCGALSRLLAETLRVLGYDVRMVQLYRTSLTRYDNHVLTEVLLDRWIIVDPTFQTTYRMDERPLGVEEVMDALLQSPAAVEPAFHGDPSHPSRLEGYYMDWRPLFANAFVVHRAQPDGPLAWIRKMPPLRWHFGPTRYYFGDELILHARLSQRMLWYVSFALPTAGLALLAAAFVSFWAGRHGRG